MTRQGSGAGDHASGRGAIFIDRDGTMIDELGYVTPDSEIKIYPFSAAAISRLTEAGFPVVVITNQGGVALGLYDEAFVDRTHALLAERLAGSGAIVTSWYYCPHHPEGKVAEFTRACECRKPGTGMLEAASRDLQIDLAASWVIGDQWRDIELAHRAGARSVLVRTGYGSGLEADWPVDIGPPTLVCDDLLAAAEAIVEGGISQGDRGDQGEDQQGDQ